MRRALPKRGQRTETNKRTHASPAKEKKSPFGKVQRAKTRKLKSDTRAM